MDYFASNFPALYQILFRGLDCHSFSHSVSRPTDEYLSGYRTDAISILGRNVMSPRGLTGLGCDTLRYSTSEIHAVFSILSNQDNYPILIHCAQGKDRTGLVVLLVLTLLNIEQSTISSDYLRSEKELVPENKERMREIEILGLSEEFAGCSKDFVEKVQQFLRESYGSVERYMTSVGIDQAMQEMIVQSVSLGKGKVESPR